MFTVNTIRQFTPTMLLFNTSSVKISFQATNDAISINSCNTTTISNVTLVPSIWLLIQWAELHTFNHQVRNQPWLFSMSSSSGYQLPMIGSKISVGDTRRIWSLVEFWNTWVQTVRQFSRRRRCEEQGNEQSHIFIRMVFYITNRQKENIVLWTICEWMLFRKPTMLFLEVAIQKSKRPLQELDLAFIGLRWQIQLPIGYMDAMFVTKSNRRMQNHTDFFKRYQLHWNEPNGLISISSPSCLHRSLDMTQLQLWLIHWRREPAGFQLPKPISPWRHLQLPSSIDRFGHEDYSFLLCQIKMPDSRPVSGNLCVHSLELNYRCQQDIIHSQTDKSKKPTPHWRPSWGCTSHNSKILRIGINFSH